MKFGLQLVHLLLYGVPVLLEHPGPCPLTTARIEGEGFFAGIERGPNVVTDQALGDRPGFLENVDRSLRIHFADEVDPAGRKRQRCRDVGELSAPQFFALQVPGGLLDGQAFQRRRRILVVPSEELWALALQLPEGSEMVLVPEACGPGPVDPLTT